MKNYLAKNIKYLRHQQHLDQETLANILDVGRSTLACWENGSRSPSINMIIKLANYFHVDLDLIMKDLETQKSLPNMKYHKQVYQDENISIEIYSKVSFDSLPSEKQKEITQEIEKIKGNWNNP